MKLKYFKEKAYNDLFDSIPENLDKYHNSNIPFLEDFFGKEDFSKESIINVPLPELYSTKNEDDIVDVRIIYNTFKNVLTPKQATNELFWTYLTHTTYWQYTRNRWSTAEMTPDAVKTRFFCGNNKNGKANRRGLLRNAIARLYWYGYLTHQDKPGKQYKLTEFMLSKSDLCQNIMDRNYSMNRNITIGMLRAILEYCEQIGRDISEEEWRELCKYINRQGAVTLLDQMSEDEVADMTIRYLLEHRQKEQ